MLTFEPQEGSVGGACPAVKDELRSVMRPEYSGYNRQVTIPKRGKGKHKASGTSFAPKYKRTPTFKNVNILRFMGIREK